MFSGELEKGIGVSFIDAGPNRSNPALFRESPFSIGSSQFSPDGRWVAFSSTESGRNEIYVAPVSGPGGKATVSTTGASSPRGVVMERKSII